MSIFGSIGEAAKKLFVSPKHEEVTPYQKQLAMSKAAEYRKANFSNQKEVHFLNPALDEHKDISKNKYGHYVSTLSYPLPPIKWEQKQHANNRRMRNSKNRFLD